MNPKAVDFSHFAQVHTCAGLIVLHLINCTHNDLKLSVWITSIEKQGVYLK